MTFVLNILWLGRRIVKREGSSASSAVVVG